MNGELRMSLAAYFHSQLTVHNSRFTIHYYRRGKIERMEILGGPLFSVAGAGESHGPGITTIVFGCPPGLQLSRSQIQAYLDRRRPGSSRHGTPRNEKDKVLLLGGLYQDDHEALTAGPAIEATVDGNSFATTAYETGFTTGEPISALVLSASSKSRHYDQFAGPTGAVRPGHTDLVKYHKAKRHVDIRGGGRSSYRSTISDVIGGSIARIFLQETFGTVIFSSISQVGPLQSQRSLSDHFTPLLRNGGPVSEEHIAEVQAKLALAEIHSLDAEFAAAAGELIKQTRIDGDSIGAAVEVVAVNVPALAGDPIYSSLKLRLMGSLGGLHAAQSCEIGDGFQVVARRGSETTIPSGAAATRATRTAG
jgi:chorismate synthase